MVVVVRMFLTFPPGWGDLTFPALAAIEIQYIATGKPVLSWFLMVWFKLTGPANIFFFLF